MDYKNSIDQTTVNYVDDSTGMISSKDGNTLQKYINDYFLLLERFYNISKLFINCDKSKLLLTCKNKLRGKVLGITLRASAYEIMPSEKIKVLGVFITSGLSNLATIKNIISKVNYRRILLNKIFKFSSARTKKLLTDSIILSVIRYASPILIDSTVQQLQSIQTIIMKSARPILGYDSLKWSTSTIMNKLNWGTIQQLILVDSLKFIHRVL